MKSLITIPIFILTLCLNTYADSVSLKGRFISDVKKTIEWMVINKHHSLRKEGDIEKLTKAMSVGDPLIHQWSDGKLKSIIAEDWSQNYTRKWKKIDDSTYIGTKPKDENNTAIVNTIKIQDKDNYYIEIVVN